MMQMVCLNRWMAKMNLPGWTDLATLSAVSVTVSLALSRVDF